MTREEGENLRKSVNDAFAKISEEEARNQRSVDRRNKAGCGFLGLVLLAIFWYTGSVPQGGRNSDAYHEAMASPDPEVSLPEMFRMPAPARDAMSEFYRDQMEKGKAPLKCPASTFVALLSNSVTFKPETEIKGKINFRRFNGAYGTPQTPPYAIADWARKEANLPPDPLFPGEGGEALSPELIKQILDKMGKPVFRLVLDKRVDSRALPLTLITNGGKRDDLTTIVGPFNQVFRSVEAESTLESLTKWWMNCSF